MPISKITGKEYTAIATGMAVNKKHIRSIDDITDQSLTRLLSQAVKVIPAQSALMFMLFEEDSTRTKVGFELGATTVVDIANPKYGDSIETLVKTLEAMKPDIIVTRGWDSYAFAECLSPAIAYVNAGDEYEHPIQALGDALTVMLYKNGIKELNISIVGDNRVARSYHKLFSRLGAVVCEPFQYTDVLFLVRDNNTDPRYYVLAHEQCPNALVLSPGPLGFLDDLNLVNDMMYKQVHYGLMMKKAVVKFLLGEL